MKRTNVDKRQERGSEEDIKGNMAGKNIFKNKIPVTERLTRELAE